VVIAGVLVEVSSFASVPLAVWERVRMSRPRYRRTWLGLVRVHGVDHPVALGVATTICLGATAAADAGLCALTFAWDTSMRSVGAFGFDHPNSVNARRSAEALDRLHRLKVN
jgi:hypothetical protein